MATALEGTGSAQAAIQAPGCHAFGLLSTCFHAGCKDASAPRRTTKSGSLGSGLCPACWQRLKDRLWAHSCTPTEPVINVGAQQGLME